MHCCDAEGTCVDEEPGEQCVPSDDADGEDAEETDAEAHCASDVKGRHNERRHFLHLLRKLQFFTSQCLHSMWAQSEDTDEI